MGQDERQANLGLILIVMLVSGAGALAVIFLSGRDAGRATAPAFPPAPVVQEAAPPAAPDADAEAPAAAGSVLPGVVREPLARRPRAPQAQAPRSAASSSAPPAADPNEADRKLVESLAGRWDERAAARVGSERGLLFALGERILRYPGALRYVLNNDLVVRGFLSQPRARRNCENAGALRDYLANGDDASGVRLGLKAFMDSTRIPGATNAILGSKLASQVLTRCPSIPALTGDPDSLAQVAMSNPALLSAIADPTIMTALAQAPGGGGLAKNLQSFGKR